jgi:hypothetical protein
MKKNVAVPFIWLHLLAKYGYPCEALAGALPKAPLKGVALSAKLSDMWELYVHQSCVTFNNPKHLGQGM